MIHKETKLIIFITLICIIPLFTHAQSWAQMENNYNSVLKNKQNDLAVSKAREMYSWAMKSEGDTSIYLPISLKLIGSAYQNSDSAIFYYDSALNVLEKQNRKYHIQSAKLHYNKSLRYTKEKNMNMSLQESEEAISILEKLKYPEYPFSDWALTNAGNICREMKKNSHAENYLKKALEIIKKNVGELHRDYLNGLNNLGSLYVKMGKYESAEIYYKQASDTYKKVLGEEHIDYASSLNRLGFLYYTAGNYKSAEPYYKQALEIQKKVLGEEHIDYGSSLNRLGFLYYTAGDYKLAEPYYKQALEIQKKVLGEEHIDYASSLNRLGLLYYEMGNYKAAEPYIKQALEIRKKALGEEHPDYAMTLVNLGILYHKMGDYKSAEPYYMQALEIRKKALGKEHPDYAMTLDNLGMLYYEMGNYKAAEPYIKQALEIQKKALGEEHPDYATTLNNLGILYKNMSDYKAAEPYYKQALEIQKKALGEEHPDYAMILHNLGTLYYEIGNYKAAEPYYKQALEIQKKALGEEHTDYAATLNNLGTLYKNMSDYKAAEPYYKQALEIRKKALGEDHPDYALILHNLGTLYYEMGNYKSAESYYKQALEITKNIKGEDYLDYARSLNGLGGLYYKMGDYKTAEDYYKKALETRKKFLGEEHIDFANILNDLGILYSEMGNYKAAESYYKQTMGIRKKVLGGDHLDYASILNNLGTLYDEMLNYKAAEPYYKQALEIRKKALGEDHPDYALILHNLGTLYYEMGNYKAAESYYKEASEIQKKALGDEHPNYATTLNNLGYLYVEKGDINSAEQIYNKAVNIKLRNIIRNFSWLSTKDKRAYLQQEIDFFQYLCGFSNLATNSVSKLTELSYNINIISKSLLLETSRELDHAISNSSDQLLKAQFIEMKQLRRLVTKMQSEGSDKKEIIERYIYQADSLDKIIVNKMGEYANAKRKFEITWKDVQATLSTKEAAIEFARYYDDKENIYKYMALVVRPEFEYPKLVKLGSELNIKNSSSQKEFSELYNYVWKGIDSLLTGVKTIYYSPVGELNNVSFSALLSENKNQSDSSKSNWSYLIDRYDLHQVTTTRHLADGTLNRNDSLPLSIKLIGGVNYSDLPLSKDSIEENETTEDFALQINLQNEVIDPKSNRGGKISYLKGSEIEVKEIAKTLKNSGWVTTISDGKNAGEYKFKEELNEKSPGIIHIATHGFAFPEKVTKEENGFKMNETSNYKVSEDPMVRCGLMLSGANVSWSGDSKKMIETTGDDGILTAAEVANLDLSNTKLVVLSACETGLGKIESSEGTFGLKRGFKLAGVDQIIVSLWKVPDNESMELMTLFYSELAKSNDIDSSFNKAQKEMRNRYPYEPEKWAGFVLVR